MTKTPELYPFLRGFICFYLYKGTNRPNVAPNYQITIECHLKCATGCPFYRLICLKEIFILNIYLYENITARSNRKIVLK